VEKRGTINGQSPELVVNLTSRAVRCSKRNGRRYVRVAQISLRGHDPHTAERANICMSVDSACLSEGPRRAPSGLANTPHAGTVHGYKESKFQPPMGPRNRCRKTFTLSQLTFILHKVCNRQGEVNGAKRANHLAPLLRSNANRPCPPGLAL
jgi:hypothetical protein